MKLSQETKAKISKSQKGNQYRWLGDSAGYGAKHQWVAKKLGQPKLCSRCGFTSDNGRQFHWANISGEYKRDLTDWVRLCVNCHRQFDIVEHPKPRANNKSGILGVYWYAPYLKWRAVIYISGKQTTIGYFNDQEDAIKARKLAETERYKAVSYEIA